MVVDQTLLIRRPIETVFAFLSDHENYARWFPGVVAIGSDDGLPHGTVGKIYAETLRLPTGRRRTLAIEVMACRPPTWFVMQADFPPLHPRTEIRLTAGAEGETRLNWKFLSRSRSTIGRLLIRALVGKSLERQGKRGLLQLKRILESDAR